MSSKKAPAKKNGKAKLPSSPGRKDKTKTGAPQKRKKGGNPRLKVLAFSGEFTFEAYFYEKYNGDEGYVYKLKEYYRGNLEDKSDDIDNLNLVDMVSQRVPDSDNMRAPQSATESYPRTIFIRYPEGNESTPETRQEGLQALRRFFQDRRFSEYPPNRIDLVDLTDEDNPPALDEYFLDDDIKRFMEEDLPEARLDREFATNYPDFARKCWKYNHISSWGLMCLGYESLIESGN